MERNLGSYEDLANPIDALRDKMIDRWAIKTQSEQRKVKWQMMNGNLENQTANSFYVNCVKEISNVHLSS